MQLHIYYIFQYSDKYIKEVEEGTWEIHMSTKQKWDRHNIKLINLAIFQTY